MQYLPHEDVPENFRHLLLEVVVTLAEAAPGMVRKASRYMATLIPQILKMMTELEEEPVSLHCLKKLKADHVILMLIRNKFAPLI